MPDCTESLTGDILYDCINAPVGGIEKDVILINQEDIDIIATTYDVDNPNIITNLQLKPGKKGFKFEGVKQSNGKAWELVKKDNSPDKFKHTFSGVIFNPNADNKLQASKLAKGGKYVVVVEQKFKGEAGQDAFEVLGIKSGLELMTMTNNSKENDNMIMLELSSADGYEEPNFPHTLLEATYVATKTSFTNKFLQAPA